MHLLPFKVIQTINELDLNIPCTAILLFWRKSEHQVSLEIAIFFKYKILVNCMTYTHEIGKYLVDHHQHVQSEKGGEERFMDGLQVLLEFR